MTLPIRSPLAQATLLLAALLLAAACSESGQGRVALEVPRGYQAELRIERQARVARFGPFVGYYFRAENPDDPGDLSRLSFVCFNEEGFYSSDAPVNARLFSGEAVLADLPGPRSRMPEPEGRITPVFFEQAPQAWLDTRPEPRKSYLHFHSLHDGAGARMDGYWLAHRAEASFTYDMGGRVGPESPLYHQVNPGPDRAFAPIVEFDRGPVRR